jgi:predicted nucleic acid-binding protein
VTPAAHRRVFLDANVLFSAAYREGAGLLELWRRTDVRLLTSGYAAEEARRNLDTPKRRDRLERLLAAIEVVVEAPSARLPDAVRLPEKDEPILRAAIAAGATHLLTGDIRDFGHLFGHRLGGLLVQTPGAFLRSR